MNKRMAIQSLEELKEYMKVLSDTAGNMSEAISVPKKVAEADIEKVEAIVSKGFEIADTFSTILALMKDLNIVKE